jgi:hypothetical protein
LLTVLKSLLRMGVLTAFVLAGCIQPTPPPPPTATPGAGLSGYPAQEPTFTPSAGSYPAGGDTPLPPATPEPATAYPAATSGG